MVWSLTEFVRSRVSRELVERRKWKDKCVRQQSIHLNLSLTNLLYVCGCKQCPCLFLLLSSSSHLYCVWETHRFIVLEYNDKKITELTELTYCWAKTWYKHCLYSCCLLSDSVYSVFGGFFLVLFSNYVSMTQLWFVSFSSLFLTSTSVDIILLRASWPHTFFLQAERRQEDKRWEPVVHSHVQKKKNKYTQTCTLKSQDKCWVGWGGVSLKQGAVHYLQG